jgi:hypothetical protein
MPGALVVVGGCAHNETDRLRAALTQCHSSTVLIYDLTCNKWYDPRSELDGTVTSIEQLDAPGLGRYAHAALTVTSNTGTSIGYIYGGFNGRMLSDMIRVEPGRCPAAQTADVCNSAVNLAGQKCMWVTSPGVGEPACVVYNASAVRTAAFKDSSTPGHLRFVRDDASITEDVQNTDSGKRTAPVQPKSALDAYILCSNATTIGELSSAYGPSKPLDRLRQALRPLVSSPTAPQPVKSGHDNYDVVQQTMKTCKYAVDCRQCVAIDCVWCNGTCMAARDHCLALFGYLPLEAPDVSAGCTQQCTCKYTGGDHEHWRMCTHRRHGNHVPHGQ